MNGIVPIDKPFGLTSGQVTQRVKNILGIEKAGHAGTLDPGTTGLLIIALGEARKAMPVLLGLPKAYEGIIHLHRDVSREKIKGVFKKFKGKVEQIPPVRSAVKRRVREREIYSLRILKISGRDIKFEVKCQAGTYIRKLAHDIGLETGSGAHLKTLRRTGVGNFSEMVKLEKLDPKGIMPLEKALEKTGLRKIIVKNLAIQKIKSGAPVRAEWVINTDPGIKKGETIGIFSQNKKIVALGIAKEPKKGIVARTDRVFKG